MLYIELVLIGISLSIDAFSLALSIGISGISRKKIKLYSFVVGIYHFIMPIIGLLIRILINKVFLLPNKEIFILVLIFILVGIILDKDEDNKIIPPVIFGLSVSLDSLAIGVGLSKKYILISSFIFSFISSIFTFIGFILANKIKLKFKKNSKLISVIILIVLIVYNVLK